MLLGVVLLMNLFGSSTYNVVGSRAPLEHYLMSIVLAMGTLSVESLSDSTKGDDVNVFPLSLEYEHHGHQAMAPQISLAMAVTLDSESRKLERARPKSVSL
mmetsp:Transcript_21473/g.49558  ORF Transcript_21473/g.49558 Transcript_21473/m.49558 type:complete len:101 (-) Transcript_21473:1378-1680(-)